MSQATCHRCGVTVDIESESHYKRVPPASAPDSTETLIFCSARCTYEYTGEDTG